MNKKLNALILCGGKGKRLGKIGKKIPKSLIKINDKPLIELILINLSNSLIEKKIISGNYKLNLFKKFLQNFNQKNIFINNDGNVEILERIKINLKKYKSRLIVCYGDELANINFSKLIESHKKSKKLLTVCTYRFKSNFGFLLKKNNQFLFREKPYMGNYNIGYMVLEYNNIKFIKNFNKIESYINKLCKINQINEYIHTGKHVTFNTIEELNEAKIKIKEFKNGK